MLAHVLSCALLAAPVHPAPEAGGGAVRDRRPEVAALLDELESGVRRSERPERMAEVVAGLQVRFGSSGPRDRRSIARGLERCVERCDPEPPAWRTTLHSAVNALATMEDEGARALIGRIGDERHEDDLELRRRLVLALGRTRSPDGIDRLLRVLDDHEPVLRGAAAEALGEFDKLEQGRRKDVFYALLQVLLDAKEKVDRDPFDVVERQRYEVVVGPITTSLQRLSGHDERDPEQWLRFWNKHKRDDWDAGWS